MASYEQTDPSHRSEAVVRSDDISEIKKLNYECYLVLSKGRTDYWKKMAAPRCRAEAILNALRKFEFESAVDIGCGGGELLLSVRSRYPKARLCGVDMSWSQIEENRKRCDSVEWVAMDMDTDNLMLGDLEESFDVAFASEIIEHVHDPDLFLANAMRLVKKGGGRLILSTQSGPIHKTEAIVGHKRHFSASEMRGMLKCAGWEPIKIWNAGFPFQDLSKWSANLSPSFTINKFGTNEYGLFQDIVCVILRMLFKLNSNKRGGQLFAIAERP